MESLQFPDVTYLPLKGEVDQKKVELVEEGEEFIESENETIDIEKDRIEQRNKAIRAVYEVTDVTQKQLGKAHGITQQQVNNIVNSD